MSDRELLELAAKAARLDYRHENGEIRYGDAAMKWNPLSNDGAALRLAVKLRLRVECSDEGQAYVWLGEKLLWNEFSLHEEVDFERNAATRRAIVRAAAEIAKAQS